jgi:hypothetical protein
VFEELIKALEGLDGKKLSVPIEAKADRDGYLDRQCPAKECEFLFKVHEGDWRNIVRDEAVWCAFCGHEAPATHWWTIEQVEKAKQAALAEVKHLINTSMRRDAERWNQRQPRNSFIKITMKVDAKPKEIILPTAASEAMQLKITCAKCSCRYAVIGSAYFCPACGHNAADHVFTQSLATIRATLDGLSAIVAAMPDKDTAQNTARVLTEDSLQRIVTAFQRYAEALFAKQPNPPAARRNVFQNLADGGTLWKQAFGHGYEAFLGAAELARLGVYFQQRHLLAHREGLVDADYIARTGDSTYREGQRLVIREPGVRECLALVEKLACGLAKDAP